MIMASVSSCAFLIHSLDPLIKDLYDLMRAPSPFLEMSDSREVAQAADDGKVRMIVFQMPPEAITENMPVL